MPKVSVIIPVYNGEKYIKRCLDSLIHQTLDDIEIICVNDCSQDSSVDIINAYIAEDSRIKLVNSPKNQGQSASKNLGILNAQGEYLMFSDQDDWLELDACEVLYNQIKQNQNDLVIFDFNYVYEKTKEIRASKIRIAPFLDLLNQPQIRLYNLKNDFIQSGFAWSNIYKTSFIKEHDIKFSEQNRLVDDLLLVIKSYVLADTVSVCERPLYNHIENELSVTYTRYDLWEEFFRARDDGFDFIKKSERSEEFLYPYLAYYIRSIIAWYKRFAKSQGIPSKIKHDFYIKMKEKFTEFNKRYKVDPIAKYFDYPFFKWVVFAPWLFEYIAIFQRKYVSFRESGDKTCYCLEICGVKKIFRKNNL